MRRNYVEFYSPGTFMSESSRKPIEIWDPALAVVMAAGVVERYGVKPYAFRFTTLLEHDPVDDGEGGMLKVQPREVAATGLHFIGGILFTLAELETAADPSEEILRRNMRNNWEPVVIQTTPTDSYKSTNLFGPRDVMVDPNSGAILRRGDEPEFMELRAEMKRQRESEREAYYTEHPERRP